MSNPIAERSHPIRGGPLGKDRWPLLSPLNYVFNELGYKKGRQRLKTQSWDYEPGITHAVFVFSEMLSQVRNVYHIILHILCHLSSPQHTEKTSYMHFRFVILLNTMTQSYYFNIGFLETQKDLALSWLAGNTDSGPPKSLDASRKFEQSCPAARKATYCISQSP